MIINFTLGGNGGSGGSSDPSKLDVTVFNEYKTNQTTIDESQNTAIDNIETDITGIKSNIGVIETDITGIKSNIGNIDTLLTNILGE